MTVDECVEMRFFQERVLEFWRQHPGEKARLAGLGIAMLWDPRATRAEGQPGRGTWLDAARSWLVPAYVVPLYVLAAAGIAQVPRRFGVLAVLLLAYGTLAAAVFVGATRYRAPWDFLLALLAAAAVTSFVERRRARRAA